MEKTFEYSITLMQQIEISNMQVVSKMLGVTPYAISRMVAAQRDIYLLKCPNTGAWDYCELKTNLRARTQAKRLNQSLGMNRSKSAA
jgi:hypothetical protein